MKFEPARIIALVTALLSLAVAFGLALTDVQSGAIVAAVVAVLQIVGGEAIRSQVYPAGKVEQTNPELSDPVQEVPFH